MNTPELVEWQRIDPENGMIQPWFTHGALDWIATQDWATKMVLQYGSGLGDAWLANRSIFLCSVERNSDWGLKSMEQVRQNGLDSKYSLFFIPCNDCNGEEGKYVPIPYNYQPDIIIVDDAYRYECIVNAIGYFKKRGGGTLIVDNWMQDYVFICPAAEELLKDCEQKIFVQNGHVNHEGRPWKTAIFFIK